MLVWFLHVSFGLPKFFSQLHILRAIIKHGFFSFTNLLTEFMSFFNGLIPIKQGSFYFPFKQFNLANIAPLFFVILF